jgi:hypothetical protein
MILAKRGPPSSRNDYAKGIPVNLILWLPAMVVLGLATLGLMFAFVFACDKV